MRTFKRRRTLKALIVFLFVLFFPCAVFGFGFDLLDRYFQISDVEENSGGTTYILGTQSNDGWCIMAVDESVANNVRFTYAYRSGNTEYVEAWEYVKTIDDSVSAVSMFTLPSGATVIFQRFPQALGNSGVY